ncbi:AIPR protein [Sporobacter termitidis DSM 10068]|uniref:AIPR protein n=1 Tax=Sporobacter termitidis DSM 10068 TaxID=1123282 RepID=A0A1M5U122_9FIRM|nr:AIPR family protein [Sporobacter termitidis]SHH56785.1 AIPR protein [Sporobacter termitidis DSM 10068]
MMLEDFHAMVCEDARADHEAGRYRTTEEAMEGILCGYLEEEQVINDIQLSPYQKTNTSRQAMMVSAHAFDEKNATLNLLAVKWERSNKLVKMSHNDVNRMFKMVRRFYRNAKAGMYKEMEETDAAYTLAQLIYERQSFISTVRVFLVSNAIVDIEPPADAEEEDTIFSYDIWDIDRIFRLIGQAGNAGENDIRLRDQYDCSICMLKMQADHQKYDCYVGMLPGIVLARIYDEHGQQLIERNVRSFLQAKNAVNKGIRDTVRDEPEMFMAYNNGISTVAAWIEADELGNGVVSVHSLHDWQIVNGGQTTASLANAYKANLDMSQVFVPVKLTILKSNRQKDLIIAHISKYANSQNKITMSDFSANTLWHVEMEKLSRRIWVPSRQRMRWFYERARGQYLVELNRQNTVARKKTFREENPKSHVVTKTIAAKCMMCAMQKPYLVSKGSETNFVKFMELVEAGKIPFPNEQYYKHMVANVILFDKCDRIVKSLQLGDYKANVVAYTIALTYRLYESEIDLDKIWARQNIDEKLELLLKKLAQAVWEHITHPTIEGTNITQWCKREECWNLLLKRQGLDIASVEEEDEDEEA